MSQAISTERARPAKKLENPCVSDSKIELGSVWAIQNRARAVRLEQENAKKSREAHRFFKKWARTGRSERKSALEDCKERATLRGPPDLVREYR